MSKIEKALKQSIDTYKNSKLCKTNVIDSVDNTNKIIPKPVVHLKKTKDSFPVVIDKTRTV
uniref:Uncharacterized protein n=1 Tax=viral metagenome TaxID=1070528 RepID=A0A6C0FA68_9ZZZZ|tara:strand:+ start:8117 stop:8299 length:183 start_codon:yes stop_codon:yes gene_type:complete